MDNIQSIILYFKVGFIKKLLDGTVQIETFDNKRIMILSYKKARITTTHAFSTLNNNLSELIIIIYLGKSTSPITWIIPFDVGIEATISEPFTKNLSPFLVILTLPPKTISNS